MDPAEAAGLYCTWVSRTALSENSVAAYQRNVRAFTTWMQEKGSEYADAFKDEHVRDYVARDWRRHLLTERKLAPSSVAQHMAAVTSFFVWAGIGKPQGVSVNVEPAGKLGLEEDDLRRVLRAMQKRGVRDYAIGQVLFQTAVRIGEAVALDVDDVLITERKGVLQVRAGKGGQPRNVALSSQARDALREWLTQRAKMPAAADNPALWLSQRGTRMSKRTIQDMVSRVAAETGVKMTAHTLRHTYARRTLEAGTDLATVQKVLGHKNISTTAVYVKPRWANIEDAVEAVRIDL